MKHEQRSGQVPVTTIHSSFQTTGWIKMELELKQISHCYSNYIQNFIKGDKLLKNDILIANKLTLA
jgi:hypothetical protein